MLISRVMTAAPYGFAVFKPSTLWPPPPPEFRKRAAESTSLHGLKEAADRFELNETTQQSQDGPHLHMPHLHDPITHHKKEQLAHAIKKIPEVNGRHTNGGAGGAGLESEHQDSGEHKAEIAEVIRVKVDGKDVELSDQIQLYATNAQVALPPPRFYLFMYADCAAIAHLSFRQSGLAAEPGRASASVHHGRRQRGLAGRDHLREHCVASCAIDRALTSFEMTRSSPIAPPTRTYIPSAKAS